MGGVPERQPPNPVESDQVHRNGSRLGALVGSGCAGAAEQPAAEGRLDTSGSFTTKPWPLRFFGYHLILCLNTQVSHLLQPRRVTHLLKAKSGFRESVELACHGTQKSTKKASLDANPDAEGAERAAGRLRVPASLLRAELRVSLGVLEPWPVSPFFPSPWGGI